jgi:hypothetical protein
LTPIVLAAIGSYGVAREVSSNDGPTTDQTADTQHLSAVSNGYH